MKILIATVLLAVLGVGSYLSANSASKGTAPATPQSCEASVTCTPQGTCLVTCHKPDGTTCTIEIDCDGDNCGIVDSQGAPDCPQACPAPCR